MSTQYNFTFRYKDGTVYSGTVVDDGTFGYSVGETIETPFGAYSIDSSAGQVDLKAGTLSVTRYHDAATGADYVPVLYSQGQTQSGGLGDEYDSISGPRGTSNFGYGGQYKAAAYGTSGGPLTLYDFVFTYRDGSTYAGTVFDDGTYGYFNGQSIYTVYGAYALTTHKGAIDPSLSKSVGAVRTTSYADATTATTYATANAKSQGGGRGLGTETDSVTLPGGLVQLFGDGGQYAVLPRGETQFTFTFTYADGSTYTGTVADNGAYGYAVGQTIKTAHGSYAITAAAPVTGYYNRPIGTVLISGYTDSSTGFYSPIYGFRGVAAGAGGLGSEHDFIDEGNGRKAFGGGGEQEARSYADTLFSFTFTYTDGSDYYGTVVDDGRFGYSVGQSIATPNGTYKLSYLSSATALPVGRVSVAVYSDASNHTVYTPYYVSIGQASGRNGLGSEYDFTKGANNYQAFGQGGAFEARQSGSTLYDFIFRYTDGSYYEGEVADNNSFGTFVGEHIIVNGGSYSVYAKSGGTALAAGTVIVSSYYDVSTRSAYSPSLGGQGSGDGAAGLGSEYDHTDGAAGHIGFGLNGTYEARQGGNPLYAFEFTYLDGSDYYGIVSDDGSYGYAVGKVIPTGYGSYRLTPPPAIRRSRAAPSTSRAMTTAPVMQATSRSCMHRARPRATPAWGLRRTTPTAYPATWASGRAASMRPSRSPARSTTFCSTTTTAATIWAAWLTTAATACPSARSFPPHMDPISSMVPEVRPLTPTGRSASGLIPTSPPRNNTRPTSTPRGCRPVTAG